MNLMPLCFIFCQGFLQFAILTNFSRIRRFNDSTSGITSQALRPKEGFHLLSPLFVVHTVKYSGEGVELGRHCDL